MMDSDAHDTLQHINSGTSVVGCTYVPVAARCFGVGVTTASNAGTCMGLNATSSTCMSCRLVAPTLSTHSH